MGRQSHLPATCLQLTAPVWPLAWWGIDIVGPLPPAPGGFRFAVVEIDYFSKWVEAEPLAKITAKNVQKFFWRNMVCRFGLLLELTVDNGKQFEAAEFKEYCLSIGVKRCAVSVEHPKANGLVEKMNGTLFHGVARALTGLPSGPFELKPVRLLMKLQLSERASQKIC